MDIPNHFLYNIQTELHQFNILRYLSIIAQECSILVFSISSGIIHSIALEVFSFSFLQIFKLQTFGPPRWCTCSPRVRKVVVSVRKEIKINWYLYLLLLIYKNDHITHLSVRWTGISNPTLFCVQHFLLMFRFSLFIKLII